MSLACRLALLALIGCKAEPSPKDTAGTNPTPTATTTSTVPTTSTTTPTTERPDPTTPTDDPCDDPLFVTIPQPGVLSRQDLRVEASGGVGPYVFSLATNASGASINPVSGAYLAGTTPGVVDIAQVDDLTCAATATVDIQVFLPLLVAPVSAQLAPGTSFDIEISRGSGSTHCEEGLIQSGGSLLGCTYTGGSTFGVDQLFVVDDLTDERVELLYTISDVTAFDPWGDTWLLPMGHPQTLRVVGGSGVVDVTPPAGLSWNGTQLTGTAEGTYPLTLTDRFTGQTAPIDVVVAAPRSSGAERDSERNDWYDSDHGDLNGDGYSDLVVSVVDGGVAAFLGGGVYVYLGSPLGLDPTPVQMFGSHEPYGYGGRSVALGDIDGDGILDLAWGAPGTNERTNADLGVVYVHKGAGDGSFDPDPTWERWGKYAGDQLGYQVGFCDVNGDGGDDLVAVALRAEDRTASPITYDTGDVRVYPGNPGGPSLNPAFVAYSAFPDGTGWLSRNTGMGHRMATGDADGDGRCDVFVAHYYEGLVDSLDYGVVLRFTSADLMGPPPVLPSRVYSSDTESQFSLSMAVGDVDADGLDDLLVGARLDDALASNAGAAYLFLAADDDGRAATSPVWSYEASWRVLGVDANDYVGWGTELFDLDGDGGADVLIGSPSDEDLLSASGLVQWFSSASVLSASSVSPADATGSWAPDSQYELFGLHIGAAGDVDGDGSPDLIAAVPAYDGEGPDTGKVVQLSLNADPIDLLQPANVRASLMGDRESAAWVDVTGDGDADLVAGAWGEPALGLGYNSGTVHVFATAAGVPSATPTESWQGFPGHSANDRYGYTTSSAGDIDGDGYEDLVLIAWNDTEVGVPDPLIFANPTECPSGTNLGGAGTAWIHRGGPAGISPDPSFVFFGYESGDHIERVAGGADVDNDGFDDLVYGSIYIESGGGVGIVHGRAASPAGITILCDIDYVFGPSSGARMGADVAVIGDLDSDGCDELAVGIDADDLGFSNQGSVRVLWGDGPACSGPAVTTLVVNQNNARFGDSVDAGLRVDGDGVPDLVGGAYAYDDGDIDRGAAWWISGSWAAGLARDPAPGWVLPSDPSTTSHLVPDANRILGEAARDEAGRGVALVTDPKNPSRALVAVGGRFASEGAGGASLWRVTAGVLGTRPAVVVGGETLAPYSQLGDMLIGHPTQPWLAVGAPFGDATWVDEGVIYPFVLP